MSFKLLDLFCGAGGCSMGYHQAGFSVTGVDHAIQKHYPFRFCHYDAFMYLKEYGDNYDVVHASPPCQRFSVASEVHRRSGKTYVDALTPMRAALKGRQCVWVIENVPGAPIKHDHAITLCGIMFGLKVFRHRHFECSHLLLAPPHPSHSGKRIGNGFFSVAGGAGRWKTWGTVMRNVSRGSASEWRNAMGIDWMTRKELTQAIPPAYTRYIGEQLIAYLRNRAPRSPNAERVK